MYLGIGMKCKKYEIISERKEKKFMMSPKENLVFEMNNLNRTLCKYLIRLSTGEIDNVAWLDLNDGCGSVLYALRGYFGEDEYSPANRKITILTPDD